MPRSAIARGSIGLLALAAAGSPLRALQAQRRVDVGLDVGAAVVRYDDFLTSGAAAVTPTLRIVSRRYALDANASSLFFQSGRSTVSGAIDGSWVAAATRSTHLALDASMGASQYATNYRYAHALVGARIVVDPAGAGPTFYLGARGGGTRSSIPADPFLGVAAVRASVGAADATAGASLALGAATLGASLRGVRAGAERVRDAGFTVVVTGGPLRLDALAGARSARVDRVRAVAEAGVTWRTGDRLAIAVHGGRYASDPVEGTVAGRFVELSARIALGMPRRSTAARRTRADEPPAWPFTRLGFEVRTVGDGGHELRVRVPGAARVEIMADFTGWEPVALHPVGDERWALVARVPPGVHRVNVRIDGGAWTVPPGLTAVADEFGGAVGLLIVE